MTRETSLPLEFAELTGRVQYVTRRGNYEYSSSCPECGGSPHPDGSFPDRFRMMIKSHATGGPLAWCRSCDFKWWPGKGKGRDWAPDPIVAKKWLDERHKSEQERKAAVEHALELLERERVWQRYQDNLTTEIRALYTARGIPDFWIDYLKLGYDPEKWFASEGQNYISPSLTIPIFEPGTWRALNVKHRLLRPVDQDDKYRPEIKGLPAALYTADPDRKLIGKVLICEGEFKSIVAHVTADDVDLTTVGLPGKSPDVELLDGLAACEPVIICLDPDAFYPVKGKGKPAIERLTDHFGKRARIMRLPGKVDDLIVDGTLTKSRLRRLMDTARAG